MKKVPQGPKTFAELLQAPTPRLWPLADEHYHPFIAAFAANMPKGTRLDISKPAKTDDTLISLTGPADKTGTPIFTAEYCLAATGDLIHLSRGDVLPEYQRQRIGACLLMAPLVAADAADISTATFRASSVNGDNGHIVWGKYRAPLNTDTDTSQLFIMNIEAALPRIAPNAESIEYALHSEPENLPAIIAHCDEINPRIAKRLFTIGGCWDGCIDTDPDGPDIRAIMEAVLERGAPDALAFRPPPRRRQTIHHRYG
jgi:hypothetical protein